MAEKLPSGGSTEKRCGTDLMASDTIITMTEEQDAPAVHDRMEVLCSEQEKLK